MAYARAQTLMLLSCKKVCFSLRSLPSQVNAGMAVTETTCDTVLLCLENSALCHVLLLSRSSMRLFVLHIFLHGGVFLTGQPALRPEFTVSVSIHDSITLDIIDSTCSPARNGFVCQLSLILLHKLFPVFVCFFRLFWFLGLSCQLFLYHTTFNERDNNGCDKHGNQRRNSLNDRCNIEHIKSPFD